jgi:hypothetical protein
MSQKEESMAGHVDVNGVYKKLGKGNIKGSMVGAVESGGRFSSSCFFSLGTFKTSTDLWRGGEAR